MLALWFERICSYGAHDHKTSCCAVVTRFTGQQVKYAGYGAVKFEWARGRLFDKRIANKGREEDVIARDLYIRARMT